MDREATIRAGRAAALGSRRGRNRRTGRRRRRRRGCAAAGRRNASARAAEEEGTRARRALAGTSKARPRSGGGSGGNGGNGGAGSGDDEGRRRLRPRVWLSARAAPTGTLGKVLERTRASSVAVAASRRPPSSGRLSTSGAAGGRGVPRATFRKPRRRESGDDHAGRIRKKALVSY